MEKGKVGGPRVFIKSLLERIFEPRKGRGADFCGYKFSPMT